MTGGVSVTGAVPVAAVVFSIPGPSSGLSQAAKRLTSIRKLRKKAKQRFTIHISFGANLENPYFIIQVFAAFVYKKTRSGPWFWMKNDPPGACGGFFASV